MNRNHLLITTGILLILLISSGCSDIDEPSLEGDYYVTMTTHNIKRPLDEQVLESEIDGQLYARTPEIILFPLLGENREHLADGYHILIANDPDFNDIVKDSTYFAYKTITIPEFERDESGNYVLENNERIRTGEREEIREITYYPRLYLPAGTYYWKVRAHFPEVGCEGAGGSCVPHEAGYGGYSEAGSFTTKRGTFYFSWPVIAKLGPFTIGTYGPMMAIGFLVGLLLLRKEFRRRAYSEDLAYNIVFAAILGGVIGAKLFSFGESLSSNWDYTVEHLRETLLSGGGLTWYGGFIGGCLSTMALIYRAKSKYNYNFWGIVDVIVPMLALGYSFGRIGCQLSADGCFGEPTGSVFGIAYPADYVSSNSMYIHPTPIYEVILNTFIFAILWWGMRKRRLPNSAIFFLYLILTAIPRYLIEFIRRNTIITGPNKGEFFYDIDGFSVLNMSISQLVSVIIFFIGIAGLIILYIKRKKIPKDNETIDVRKKELEAIKKRADIKAAKA